ncbi:MAG: hypothetical protein K8R67_03175 [Desulfobacteraceae bacterium]|nr:hypothetical protein [Desulfobacteraceae bacterium]
MRSFLTLLFILFSQVLFSQSLEVVVGVQSNTILGTFINEDIELEDFENQSWMVEEAIGYRYPVIKINEDISFGLQAYLYLSQAITAGGNTLTPTQRFGIRTPGYLSFNYGAGSSRDSYKVFGVGAGIGYTYNILICDIVPENSKETGIYTFANPTVMFEIPFNLNNSSSFFNTFKLRFEKQINMNRLMYSTMSGNYYYDFDSFNISYVLYFN